MLRLAAGMLSLEFGNKQLNRQIYWIVFFPDKPFNYPTSPSIKLNMLLFRYSVVYCPGSASNHPLLADLKVLSLLLKTIFFMSNGRIRAQIFIRYVCFYPWEAVKMRKKISRPAAG